MNIAAEQGWENVFVLSLSCIVSRDFTGERVWEQSALINTQTRSKYSAKIYILVDKFCVKKKDFGSFFLIEWFILLNTLDAIKTILC